MTNTIEEVLAYAKAHPTRDGESWAGWCESLVWRAGGFDGSFNSAQLAGDASGWLNPNWASAPRGALHYWSGVGGDGHVAFELGGGALLMASSQVSSLGDALGIIHFTNYRLPEYRGWSLRHGIQTLATSGTAGGEATPIPEPPKEQEIGMAQRTYYARVNKAGDDDGEWMLAGVDIPPLNPDGTEEERKQDGYRITTDKETARIWARQYSFAPNSTGAVHLTRDLYVKQQEFARKDAAAWRAGIRALFAPAARK